MKLNEEQTNKVLHACKAIVNARRQYIDYIDEIMDELCSELNIDIPERREGERRSES